MRSSERHKRNAESDVKSYCAGVITVSDTRDKRTDRSGRLACSLIKKAGGRVLRYRVIKDEVLEIRIALLEMLSDKGIQVIVLDGGTGISPKDVTPEAIEPFLDKRIDGFGELFRSLSFDEIGTASMLSRALAGVARNGVVVFALPGSPDAVRLAMEKIILPELRHLVSLAKPER